MATSLQSLFSSPAGAGLLLSSSRSGFVDALSRLASGRAIQRAADDPSGLIRSEQMSAALIALDAEYRSLERADAMLTTADGALGEVSDLLAEAEGLAVAAADDASSKEEREAYQLEFDSIMSTVSRLTGETTFQGESLFDGEASVQVQSSTLDLHSLDAEALGDTEIEGESYSLGDVKTGGALGLVSGDAEGAATVISAARQEIALERARIASFSANDVAGRMENLSVAYENMSAAVSSIRDTDYAFETAELARMGILQLSAISMFRSRNIGGMEALASLLAAR